jgi:hypothetical protein
LALVGRRVEELIADRSPAEGAAAMERLKSAETALAAVVRLLITGSAASAAPLPTA